MWRARSARDSELLRVAAQKLRVMSGAGISVQARYPWLLVLLTDVHFLCPKGLDSNVRLRTAPSPASQSWRGQSYKVGVCSRDS